MLEARQLRAVAAALSVFVVIGCGRIPPSEVAGGAPTTTAEPPSPTSSSPTPTVSPTAPPTPTPTATRTGGTPTPTTSPTTALGPTASSTLRSPTASPSASTSASGSASNSVSNSARETPSQPPRRSTRPSASPRKSEKPQKGPETGRRRVVYLTFDDGPSQYSRQVLDILARYNAKATFFVIGQNAAGDPSGVRAMARAGMSVQNHSWAHADLRTLSDREIRSDIGRTDEAIRRAGGGSSDCVRPPYGATNSRVRAVLRDLGKRQQLWTIDTNDWERPGADRIYRRTVSAAESGSVVLAHDGGGVRTQTVAALPRILQTLRDRGYRFGTLCP
jgi:peptidoglycan-N-acetylglucosamine deacetylase